MTRQEELEIERLVGDVAEEGASAERIGRLNELLLDRDDLQLHYAHVMALHSILAYELNLSLQSFSPLPELQGTGRDTNHEACKALSDKMASDAPLRGVLSARKPFFAFAAACLAAAVVVAVYPFVADPVDTLNSQYSVINLSPAPLPSENLEKSASGELTPGNRNLVLSDAEELEPFSRVTKTTPISSMMLPVCNASDFPMLTFCSGTVWMERPTGQRARGYMVSVPSGCSVEVCIDAEARCQNALALIEIDMYGRMTGSAVNFNNVRDDVTSGEGFGTIGNWSHYNNTPATKYYLFSGTHSYRDSSSDSGSEEPKEPWYQSDYRVLLETPDLIFIGWDDCGYTSNVNAARIEGIADYDYDDICAFVRITKEGEEPQRPGFMRFLPERQLESDVVVEMDEMAYEFSVQPGEKVALRMSTNAFLQNGLDVVDAETGRVLWHTENDFPAGGVRQPSKANVYLIENGTDQPQRYFLRAQHKNSRSDENHPWEPSPYRILKQEATTVAVGFEDSQIPKDADWNDIQVQVRRIPEAK